MSTITKIIGSFKLERPTSFANAVDTQQQKTMGPFHVELLDGGKKLRFDKNNEEKRIKSKARNWPWKRGLNKRENLLRKQNSMTSTRTSSIYLQSSANR